MSFLGRGDPILRLVIGVVFFSVGCSDTPEEPACYAGEILGVVVGGKGEPVLASIQAVPTSHLVDVHAEVDTDTLGRFRLAVPPGNYYLKAFTRPTGWSYGGCTLAFSSQGPRIWHPADQGDTIIVDEENSCTRADFRLGTLELSLSVPLELEGDSLWLSVKGRCSYSRREGIENGVVEANLAGAPPDTYRIAIRPYESSLESERIWFPGSFDERHADRVVVGPDPVTFYAATLPSPSKIRGEVRGSHEEMGVDRFRVVAYADLSAGPTDVASILVEQDSRFELTVFATATVRLQTWIGQVGRWIGGGSFFEATAYDLVPGREIVLPAILENGIWGHLAGPDGSGPDRPPFSRVYLENVFGDTLAVPSIANDGVFRTPNLAPGVYYVRVDKDRSYPPVPWAPQWFDGADSRDQATPIELKGDGQASWIDVVLQRGGTIRGRVIVGESVVPATEVTLTGAADREPVVSRVPTLIDGSFLFIGLADGAYKVGLASPFGFDGFWYPGVAQWDSAGIVRIESHQHVTGIDLELPE